MSTSRPAAPVHAPMSQFSSQGSQLMVGGLPLAQMAERVGQTPFYAYDRKLIKQRRLWSAIWPGWSMASTLPRLAN